MATIRRFEVLILLGGTTALELVLARIAPTSLIVDLPLILVVYVGWYSTPVKAATVGAAFGLLQDVVLGLTLGINGISKTLIGFCSSGFKKWVVPEGYWLRGLVLIGLSLLDRAIVYGLLHLIQQPLRPDYYQDILIGVGITGAVGGIVFQIYDRIKFPPKDFRHIGYGDRR